MIHCWYTRIKLTLETSVLLTYKFEYLRIQEFLVIFTPRCLSQEPQHLLGRGQAEGCLQHGS